MTGGWKRSRRGAGLLFGAALLGVLGGCREATSWHRNGTRHARGRLDRSGRPEGPWRFWYPSGRLREEGRFEAGRRAGTWTQWHPNGQKASRGRRGWDPESGASVRRGPWTFWFPSGYRAAQGHYDAHGRRTGAWEFWIDTGRRDSDRSGVYEAGRRVAPLGQ